MSVLTLLEDLDRMQRELQDDYPGWRIWYVFHLDGSATWHARPKPWLNARSPDNLRKLIGQAQPHTEIDDSAGQPFPRAGERGGDRETAMGAL